jgi:predicted TIM-barrel fold metal-dependent hydrolase
MTLLVDVHAHLYPDVYLEALRADSAFRHESASGRARYYSHGGLVLGLPGPSPTMAERLVAMDEAGVDRQLLSVAGPGVMFAGGQGAALAEAINDDLLLAAQTNSHRFGVLLTLPLHDVEACLQEVARVGDAPGVVGACVLTTSGTDHICDARFDPLWKALDARRHVVLVHPTTEAYAYSGPDPDLALYAGFPHETIKTLAGLMLANHDTRYPGISWILCHLGGGVAALWDRVTTGLISAGVRDSRADVLARVRSHFLFDSVCTHPPALRCFVDTFGSEAIVFGTDYPHIQPIAVRDTLDADPARDALLAASRNNISRILGRDKRRAGAPAAGVIH